MACEIGVFSATPPSTSSPSPRDGRQAPGDGGACHDGVDDRAAREEGLVPDDDVNSDDVRQNRELLEASSLEVLGHELSQPGARTR